MQKLMQAMQLTNAKVKYNIQRQYQFSLYPIFILEDQQTLFASGRNC
jgi:hypothetical protein